MGRGGPLRVRGVTPVLAFPTCRDAELGSPIPVVDSGGKASPWPELVIAVACGLGLVDILVEAGLGDAVAGRLAAPARSCTLPDRAGMELDLSQEIRRTDGEPPDGPEALPPTTCVSTIT